MLLVHKVFFPYKGFFANPEKNVANMCFILYFLIGVYLLKNNKHFLLNAQIYARQGNTDSVPLIAHRSAGLMCTAAPEKKPWC